MSKEEHIIKCEDSLIEAMKIGNISTLDDLLHDDLIFNFPTGITITKSMDLENYWSGVMSVYDIDIHDRTIKIIEDCAIVLLTFQLKAKYNEQIIDNTFRYLRVWKFHENTWQIIAGSGFHV